MMLEDDETSITLLNPISLLLTDKRSPATRRAYAGDLAAFFAEGASETDPAAVGLEAPAGQAAVAAFLALPAPQIALRLAHYKAAMIERGLSEATINRRLSAVRSLLKFSFRLGLSATDGRGLVDGEKATAYRDTRGVDLKTLRRLVALPDVDTLRGRRDAALLRLLAENALRRAEVCALNVADFSLTERRLMILGKGKGTQRAPVTLSAKCADAVATYLITAGHAADAGAPLFVNVDHRPHQAGARLTADGLYFLVASYGRQIGLDLTPHKLRHSAITAALDATGGDVRKVQRLSRHADLRTLTRYDDNRADLQGEVTGLLSGLL